MRAIVHFKTMQREYLDKRYRHLESGKKYIVVNAFKDYDKMHHPVGESWVFIGSNFLPYDDGLSLFVEIEGTEYQIRLQHRPEEQGDIIGDLEHYVSLAG